MIDKSKKIIITSTPIGSGFDYFKIYLEFVKYKKRMERLEKLKIILNDE